MNFKNLFNFGRDKAYAEAMRLYNRHLYREAIEKFEAMLKATRSSTGLHHTLARFYCGQAYHNLGMMLFAVENFNGAIKEFQNALLVSEQHMDSYHFIGVCQNNLGDYAGAVKTFNTILEIDPSHLTTKIKLGIAFHNMKMWAMAEDVYSSILQNNPEYADVYFRRGLACLGQGKVNEALGNFKRATRINSGYVEAWLKMGIAQAYSGYFNEALATFSEMIGKFPDYADIHYYLGIVYAGSDAIDKAMSAFQKALKINPSYKGAKVKLGMLYCFKNELEAGLQELKEALSFEPEDGNLKMAIDALEDMMAGDAKNFLEGKGFFGWNKLIAQTVCEFNRHIVISPDLSDMLLIIQNFPESDRASFEVMLPLVKDYIAEHPEYPDLHNSLGTIYRVLRKTVEAEACFRKALLINPGYLQARINLLGVLKDSRKWEEALQQGLEVVSKGGGFPDVYCTLGEVCLALTRWDDTRQHAQSAIALNPAYGHAHVLMAQVYAERGARCEAIEALEKGLSCQPPEIVARRARELLNALHGGKTDG